MYKHEYDPYEDDEVEYSSSKKTSSILAPLALIGIFIMTGAAIIYEYLIK